MELLNKDPFPHFATYQLKPTTCQEYPTYAISVK